VRVLVQRVASARVEVGGVVSGSIGAGLLVLVGVEEGDGETDLTWLSGKICKLRIFADAAGVMNRSVIDVGGEMLAVSQFTLFASLKKGNRPSWGRAAPPEISRPMFDRFVRLLEFDLRKPVPTGVFGADMQVHLVNDGPVTIFIDSQNPE
jgi:D-aminoacyl-tRNA deacylase